MATEIAAVTASQAGPPPAPSYTPPAYSSNDQAGYLAWGIGRNVGGIVADVVIEESSDDQMTTTDHPVEMGAPITDHAYMHPPTLRLRLGWTDSGRGPGFCAGIYRQLLQVQFARTLLAVVTGKRAYKNMLITAIRIRTDTETEHALVVDMELSLLILAQTQAVSIDPSVQQNPADTSPIQQTPGQSPQQPTPSQNQSILSRGQQAIGGKNSGFNANNVAPTGTNVAAPSAPNQMIFDDGTPATFSDGSSVAFS